MESTSTKKKLKWYHYIFIFILFVALVNLCTNTKKDKIDTENETTAESIKTENKTEAEETKWVYKEEPDKMTSKVVYMATIIANNKLDFQFPYNGGSEAYLMIRKKDGSTNIALRVSKGQFVSSIRGGSVRLRFDKEPPITISTSESSDGSSDILFLNSESKIISKLKKSTSLIIEAEFFNEGNRIIEFTTKDFKWNH